MAILRQSSSTTSKNRLRGHRRRADTRSWRLSANLRLRSCGLEVPLGLAAGSPTLLVVAVEDLCWQLAMDAWRARRPKPWHPRRRAAWHAEQAVLTAKRLRLTIMAKQELDEM
jgi:hypothetical protein